MSFETKHISMGFYIADDGSTVLSHDQGNGVIDRTPLKYQHELYIDPLYVFHHKLVTPPVSSMQHSEFVISKPHNHIYYYSMSLLSCPREKGW